MLQQLSSNRTKVLASTANRLAAQNELSERAGQFEGDQEWIVENVDERPPHHSTAEGSCRLLMTVLNSS